MIFSKVNAPPVRIAWSKATQLPRQQIPDKNPRLIPLPRRAEPKTMRY
jgi:hypothetical protein